MIHSAATGRSARNGRHGDVLLRRVDRVPDDAVLVDRPPDEDIILAWGEVTGHAHRIKSRDVAMFRVPGGARFVVFNRAAGLAHEEHKTLTAEPGETYQVIQQVEYVPGAVPRNVAD